MKKHFILVCATILFVSACGVTNMASNTNGQVVMSAHQYRLANTHWTDLAKIRAEAQRLSTLIGNGTMTKVQAAQHLNRYRVQLVGNNSVDDSVYEVYQRAAVESQRGSMTSAQARAYLENALKGWQQRWPSMQHKPANPAFTNFLLESMGMKHLQ